ncbi:MAG TPA: hypothetical protein DGB85_12940 [Deltaproteobacteria bacterium]|nr:hypothetical protein [Deltaproteobacteria bacterium]
MFNRLHEASFEVRAYVKTKAIVPLQSMQNQEHFRCKLKILNLESALKLLIDLPDMKRSLKIQKIQNFSLELKYGKQFKTGILHAEVNLKK